MTAKVVDFVHTGPGTIAGRYLRLFWQPVFRSEDLLPGRAAPLRIMNENFTLYRGESGNPRIVEFRCPHRGTLLSIGLVEDDCIRCHYHGWKFDGSGQCLEQPGEDEAFAQKVKIRSYPTTEYLGLIFAFLGDGEVPEFRRYPDFEREGALKVGTAEKWPCNYFNRCENGLNSAHVAFTHRESALRVKRPDRLAIRQVSVEETDYGIKETQNVPGRPTQYVHFHMPNVNQPRSALRIQGALADAGSVSVDRLFWYVPVDDEHCVTFVVDWVPITGDSARKYLERSREAQQKMNMSPNELAESIITGKMRIQDIDPDVSTYFLFWVEDYLSMVGQGAIPDRSHEHLGRMDAGVILLRKIWERELLALADGRSIKQWTSPAGLADQTQFDTAAKI